MENKAATPQSLVTQLQAYPNTVSARQDPSDHPKSVPKKDKTANAKEMSSMEGDRSKVPAKLVLDSLQISLTS